MVRARRVPLIALNLLLWLAACHGGEETSASTTDDTEGATETSTAGTTESAGETTAATGTTDATGGSTTEPSGDGLRGILNFTYFAADAVDDAPILGMAGAYRGEALVTDDLFALQDFQIFFPRPPAGVDAIEEHARVPFEWGKADTWTAAGNGMKLGHPEAGDALACLFLADDSFPIYIASGSEALAAECAPDPAHWLADAEYRLVLYGGDAFDDRIIDGQVRTPAALTVSAPDLSIYNLEVDTKKDLALAWEAGDDPAARIIIHVWDQYGQLTAVTASDDGAFTIPAANLAAQSGGPGFLTVARERPLDIPFEGGTIRVIPRYEIWGYIDLLE